MARSTVALTGALLVVIAGTAAAVDWPNKIPSAAERGATLYDRHCLACHGALGAGDGPLAASLVSKVPDLSAGLGSKDRTELIRIVMKGRGVMPGFEQSFKDLLPASGDIRDYARNVLDHMDRLKQRKEADAPVEPEEPEVDEVDGD